MASQHNILLTAEQYLDLEEKAEYKSEYIDGEIFAMAGASRAHDIIVRNIGSELHSQFKHTPCIAHTGDMRVAASPASAYTYPDISIACQDARYFRRGTDNLLNPVAIIEVLSPSTEIYDRRQKFGKYREMSSLREYVLVSQDEILVERFARQPNGDWLYSSLTSRDDSLTLTSVPATLKLRDIYDRVFPAADEDSSSLSS
jgi:Uma2 family endonuclease